MSMWIEKVSRSVVALGQSFASVIKVMLQSRATFKICKTDENSQLVILGNGPSLNTTIADHRDFLMNKHRLAVNFAANAPVFFELKPSIYVLADPHFFYGIDSDLNVEKLWQNINAVDWEMSLLIPVKFRKLTKRFKFNPHISMKFFNLTPVEGLQVVRNVFYDLGLGMPRPRNVLIPSIMLAIRLGYGKIYIAGADHSWTQTLWVNDKNQVVSIQPHFYEDNDSEKKRVATEYHKYPLHQILQSLYIAFRSYFDIATYARHRNVEIVNITPDSFIDAFPRMKL